MKRLKDDMIDMLIMVKVPGFEIGFVCKTKLFREFHSLYWNKERK